MQEVIPSRSVLADLVPSGGDALYDGGGGGSGAKRNGGEDDRPPKMDFSTCAVVGNSGVLLMSEYGEHIDAHSFVMRLNVAPTVGPVRKHVGGKTHIRLLNNKWSKVVAGGGRLPIKVESGCTLLLRTTDGQMVNRAKQLFAATATATDGGEKRGSSSISRARAVAQFNYKAVEGAKVALGAYRGCLRARRKPVGKGGDLPSAGFAAVLALSRVCGKLRLFGFGSAPPGAKSKREHGEAVIGYQYFVERNEDGTLNAGSPSHNFDLEFMALQSLAKNVKSVTLCGPGEQKNGECNEA